MKTWLENIRKEILSTAKSEQNGSLMNTSPNDSNEENNLVSLDGDITEENAETSFVVPAVADTILPLDLKIKESEFVTHEFIEKT